MQSYRDLVIVVVSRGKKDKVLGGMPLFGEAVSPYDEVIEKVTAETCTSENWTLILDICDKVVAEQSKGGNLFTLHQFKCMLTLVE